MKKCTKCETFKSHDDFHRDKNRADGLSFVCKGCAIAKTRAWYRSNKDRVLAEARATYALNPSTKNQQARKWREQNTERKRENDKAWRLKNIESVRASKMRRKITKIERRRPYDLEFFSLLEFEAHELANLREARTGIKWHVDHIVPLKSKLVCGFHNEFNLAVITAKQNMSKGNRYWPDKP